MTKPAPRENVTDEFIMDANAFLEALSARSDRWKDGPWIFRGQSNPEWTLRASGARDQANPSAPFAPFGISGWKSLYDSNDSTPPTALWSLRHNWVVRMLKDFQRELNRQGLTVPQEMPPVLETGVFRSSAFPDERAFPLMALAQHHCLPTLFLDWTTRAWVAAHFAALDSARAAPPTEWLSVWCFLRDERDLSSAPKFYEPPASTNPNLRAQSGLFTWFPSEQDVSLEEHIVWLNAQSHIKPKYAALRRLMLPATEAPRLLRLLALEGITGASMFPGPDGVVRAMRERTLWDTAKVRGTK